ncbi:MAG: cupin domain-containing protein [Bacillota bacterium]
MAVFVYDKTATPLPVGEGLTRKMMSYGGSLMMTKVQFAPGAIGAAHSHPHEQVSYVARGRFQVTIAGETQVLVAGDSFYVPSDAVHGVVALEEGELIDIFTPQREDFLK